jgi:hypothetical protein
MRRRQKFLSLQSLIVLLTVLHSLSPALEIVHVEVHKFLEVNNIRMFSLLPQSLFNLPHLPFGS